VEGADKVRVARALLERALRVSDGERAWLLALAWSQLQEAAEALERASGAVALGHGGDGAVPGVSPLVC
jgi:hypothetical protein